MFFSQQMQIANLAGKTGLPAMFPESEYVNAAWRVRWRGRIAFRRDKILHGSLS